MKYQVIWGYDVPGLTKEVTTAIADGWSLVGGLAVAQGDQPVFLQAMTKRELGDPV